MTINVSHLVNMTDTVYKSAVKFYTGERGLNQALRYETFIFSALVRYAASGDATHLNNCVLASRTMNRVRQTTRILKGFAAHKWDTKRRIFDCNGKANKALLARLRKMDESSIAMQVADALEDLQNDSRKAEEEFDINVYVKRVVAILRKNGVDIAEFQQHVTSAAIDSKAA